MNDFVVFTMLVGTIILIMGLHYIDNAWNMNSACWDTDMMGNTFTKTELYKQGIVQVMFGMAVLVASIFTSGVRVNKPLNSKIGK